MFLNLPSTVVDETKTKTTAILTDGAKSLPINKMFGDIYTTIMERVVDFGHGAFILREYHHGAEVPYEFRNVTT